MPKAVQGVTPRCSGRWRSSGLKVTLGEEKVEVGTTFEELGIEVGRDTQHSAR